MTQSTTGRGVSVIASVAVHALRPHRANGIARAAREEYRTDPATAKHLQYYGFVLIIPESDSLFDQPAGRMLRTDTPAARPWGRVVACLNIWQDRAALEETIGTWYDHVDHVLAIDGPYASTGRVGPSTDGTVEFLAQQAKVELLTITDGASWPDQNAKRNAYLARLAPGDLAFIVDADEFVSGAALLRTAPDLDVGWVRVTSALYQRPYGQPRLLRADPALEYRGRHHWIYRGDEVLATHQYGGAGEHAAVPLTLRNARGLGHTDERANAKRLHQQVQAITEHTLRSSVAGADNDAKDQARESLRILQLAKYDAGLACSRLHTALNATTPHASVYLSGPEGRPYGVRGQFDLTDTFALEAAFRDADVVHCHLTLGTLPSAQLAKKSRVVLHHHGSMLRQAPDFHRALAAQHQALVLVSTLELLQYAPDATWLPNPVPVARYRRLRDDVRPTGARSTPGVLRVAHSPSKRHLKGTDDFLAVCERLRARGVPIEPVLIENVSHAEGLRMKASCDACFDAFFIGLQCSGIEAAAMGMPVVAGDLFAAAQYRARFGAVPYTFANDADALETVLAQLAEDEAFFVAEAARVTTFVAEHHDEAAVALRYLDLLDERFGWRESLALEPRRPTPIVQTPPAPVAPAPPAPETPAPKPVKQPKRRKPVTR